MNRLNKTPDFQLSRSENYFNTFFCFYFLYGMITDLFVKSNIFTYLLTNIIFIINHFILYLMFDFINENTETIIAISSVFIALVALGFSIWQGRKTIQHNKLSVTPHIDFISFFDTQSKMLIYKVLNNGIGPAVIEKVSIFISGKLMEDFSIEGFTKVLSSSGLSKVKLSIEFARFSDVLFLNVNSDIVMLRLFDIQELTEHVDKLYSFYQSVHIEIKYRSLYKVHYFSEN